MRQMQGGKVEPWDLEDQNKLLNDPRKSYFQ